MSKQKVKIWVEKMPESCGDCPCCGELTCNLTEIENIDFMYINKRESHCPLHSIKDYKRELVKKVRENIIERYNLEGKPITGAFGDTQYGYIMVSAKDLKQFLDQIQKEYEK